jgi:hypothetical protein
VHLVQRAGEEFREFDPGGGTDPGVREQAVSDNTIAAQMETRFMVERKQSAHSDDETIARQGAGRKPGSAGCNRMDYSAV